MDINKTFRRNLSYMHESSRTLAQDAMCSEQPELYFSLKPAIKLPSISMMGQKDKPWM